jgi:Tol biopolymer transport system component
MDWVRLSPDGHAVAFSSRVNGISQVFLMLTSGGEPLQLTYDEGNKFVNGFSHDGREVYYSSGGDGVLAVPSLGGSPRRVVSAAYAVSSLDGNYIYYRKSESPGIFRAEKSGLDEELVYKPEDTSLDFFPLLLFPGGHNLLVGGGRGDLPSVRIVSVNLTSHKATDLVEISGYAPWPDLVWDEPGSSVLFSRTINELTNIWKYNIKDRSLRQITFGTGPDYAPMPDPNGKGIYYVNGRATGSLIAYHVQSKESMDIVSEEATQPIISHDGKRVMYITLPTSDQVELWVSDIDGGNKLRIANGEVQGALSLSTLNWAPDNFHLSFSQRVQSLHRRGRR